MAEHPFAQYLSILGRGRNSARSLTFDESLAAMQMILAKQVEDVQLGAFLMLLRVKEESPEELAGFAQAVRLSLLGSEKIHADLDWPSYAGKKNASKEENLHHYILSMLLLSDYGVSIFCHGARGHTDNRVYTEDVFHALGLPIANNLTHAKTLIKEKKLCYLSLENYCSELNKIINLRDLFGLRSPVHSFVKLINPGACKHIIVPIFHPSYKPVHQSAGLLLNEKEMAIFKGESGEAERRPQAILSVDYLKNGAANTEKWPAMIEILNKEKNKETEKPSINLLLDTWRNDNTNTYAYHAIIGTCALALHLCKKANTQNEAIKLATELWQQRNKKLL